MTKPVRVGISGCGGITPWTFEQLGLNPGLFEVVAVQDPRTAARDAIGDRFGVARRHAELDDLLDELLDEDVGFLILNGPNDVHRSQVEAAAGRGIPCLVQKPLAPSVVDATAMLDAARGAAVALGVVMMERGDPLNHAVRDLVQRGFVGEPTLIEGTFAHDLYLQNPPAADDWRRDPTRVGGAAFTQLALHSVDLAEWLCGLDVTEVAAVAAGSHSVFNDETTVAALRFGPHTAGIFGASWAANTRRVAVHGTGGSIAITPEEIVLRGRFDVDGLLRYTAPDQTRIARAGLEGALATQRAQLEVHARFARSLVGDGDNPCRGDEALHAVCVMEAVRRSIADNAAIQVPPR